MEDKSLGHRIVRILIFIVLFILAVSFVYPILFMFINSLKTLKEY